MLWAPDESIVKFINSPTFAATSHRRQMGTVESTTMSATKPGKNTSAACSSPRARLSRSVMNCSVTLAGQTCVRAPEFEHNEKQSGLETLDIVFPQMQVHHYWLSMPEYTWRGSQQSRPGLARSLGQAAPQHRCVNIGKTNWNHEKQFKSTRAPETVFTEFCGKSIRWEPSPKLSDFFPPPNRSPCWRLAVAAQTTQGHEA